MASVVASSAVVAPSAFAAATPSSAVESSSSQSFVGLKSAAGVFASKSASLSSKAVSNGSRVQCMQVWTPISNLKFETLSYLPPLSPQQISKEIDYMLENKWIPCLEFDSVGVIYRKYHKSPGYYDGRYWTMWKLPMFGCTDSGPVLREIELLKKEYPNCYIRVLGFDNVRQVQCSAFIVHKPATPRLPQLGLQARPGQRLPGLPSISPSYSSRPAQPLRTPSRPQQEAPQRETNSSFSSSEFRPPTSALPTDPLDWEALSVVGKFAEKLVDQPITSQARKLREQRWQRLQQAASELSGLTGAIASNSAAHELYIQEIEDTIDLLRRASTQQNANLQSAVGRFVASYYRNK